MPRQIGEQEQHNHKPRNGRMHIARLLNGDKNADHDDNGQI